MFPNTVSLISSWVCVWMIQMWIFFPSGWRNSSPGHQCSGCNIFDLMSLLDTRKSSQLCLWLALTLMKHSPVASEVLLGLSSCLWYCPPHRRRTEGHSGLWTSLEKFGEVLSSRLILNQKILVFPCWHGKWAKCWDLWGSVFAETIHKKENSLVFTV